MGGHLIIAAASEQLDFIRDIKPPRTEHVEINKGLAVVDSHGPGGLFVDRPRGGESSCDVINVLFVDGSAIILPHQRTLLIRFRSGGASEVGR